MKGCGQFIPAILHKSSSIIAEEFRHKLVCVSYLAQMSLMSVPVRVLPQQPGTHIIVVLAYNVSLLFLHRYMLLPVFNVSTQMQAVLPGLL
jgi:hypothetical protein